MQQGIAQYRLFTRYCEHDDRTSHGARHTRPLPLVLASDVAFVKVLCARLQQETHPTPEVWHRTLLPVAEPDRRNDLCAWSLSRPTSRVFGEERGWRNAGVSVGLKIGTAEGSTYDVGPGTKFQC